MNSHPYVLLAFLLSFSQLCVCVVSKLKEKFVALQHTTGGQTVDKLKAELSSSKHLNEQLKIKIKKYHALATKSDLLSKKVVEKSAEVVELRKQLATLRTSAAASAARSPASVSRRLSSGGRRESGSLRSPMGPRAPTSRRPARATPSRSAAIDTAMLKKRADSPSPAAGKARGISSSDPRSEAENNAPNPYPSVRRSSRSSSTRSSSTATASKGVGCNGEETRIVSRSAALLSRIQRNLERCDTSNRS
jgi:ribosomal protein L29